MSLKVISNICLFFAPAANHFVLVKIFVLLNNFHCNYPSNAAAANLVAIVDPGVAAAAAAVAAGHKANAAGEGAAAQHCGLQKNCEFGPTDGDEEEGEQF